MVYDCFPFFNELDILKLRMEIMDPFVDKFVIEEAAAGSGIKQTVAWELQKRGYSGKVHGLDLGSDFTPHGDMEKLYRLAGIDADSIVEKVREVLCDEE